MLIAGSAMAGSVTLTWENATQNTDGSAIPATGPGSLVSTKIAYSPCVDGDLDEVVDTVTVPASATSHVVDIPGGFGDYCFRAVHTNTFGKESAVSNLAVKPLEPPTPQPPQNLVTDDVVAYGISQTPDRLVLIPVGTVPLGTACDPSMSVNGYNLVPRAAVDWAGTSSPAVVLAACGSGG